ncbi:MAG: sialate O-acetylesterase [Pirellulaceae bacterium]|jgi:sialate O-acetylesterase
MSFPIVLTHALRACCDSLTRLLPDSRSHSLRTARGVLALCITMLLTCLLAEHSRAEVSLPSIFSDHMVLQRDQANKVWGKATPAEKVTVKIAEQSQSITADDNGLWHVMLQPLPVGGPLELSVSSDSNEVKISDVLVGEVWICSGQSNMQWNVGNSTNADLERLAADHPNLRMINFPQVGTQEPVWDHPNSKWMICTPETVGSFSAVGYFFGRQLLETLDVPIGMINNAWGGSACEAWISRENLEEAGKYSKMLEQYDDMAARFETLSTKKDLTEDEQKQLKKLNSTLHGNHRPANIYNGVLKSHLGYGIRGAIWYQGESNAGRAYQYRELFPLMISSWRAEWGQGDFPFYWVQLADFMAEKPEPADSAWAELREAQTMTESKLKHTGEAVIIDIGEGKDIHPKNKVEVGMRLSRLALHDVYGIQIANRSPQYKSMEKAENKIVLSFDHVDGGWRPFDTNEPVGFSVAGEDKKFVWADAKILEDGRIEVSSDAVANPVAVRYAWADNPVCNMFDGAGLPLTPFRTDDWPGVTVDNQ